MVSTICLILFISIILSILLIALVRYLYYINDKKRYGYKVTVRTYQDEYDICHLTSNEADSIITHLYQELNPSKGLIHFRYVTTRNSVEFLIKNSDFINAFKTEDDN